MSDIERFNSGRVLPRSLPFSEATAVGGMVFLSGQLGNVPGTLTLVEGGIEPETRQALANVRTVLEGQGLGLHNLLRCGLSGRRARRSGAELACGGTPLPVRPTPMMHELTPSELALLRRARVEIVDAPSTIAEIDALSLAGLLGRECGNTYRITTTGLLLLEQLDASNDER
jgi:hypothetical protein